MPASMSPDTHTARRSILSDRARLSQAAPFDTLRYSGQASIHAVPSTGSGQAFTGTLRADGFPVPNTHHPTPGTCHHSLAILPLIYNITACWYNDSWFYAVLQNLAGGTSGAEAHRVLRIQFPALMRWDGASVHLHVVHARPSGGCGL